MITIVCAVRDAAAKAFNRPFTAPSTGVAIRSFASEVNRVDAANLMNTHPSDFELYEVGTFDEDTGIVAPCTPRSIARAVDHVVKE